MSNIYIQEPPTNGKVLLETTVGDIDIELWSKETPRACRNFVQLCLDGYYDKTIFHRIIKGFIAQSGDPTGTGLGGDSIYGKPFKDEFHTRLRFCRRGLVGLANSGPNDNTSQFFFTFDSAPQLTEKHTLFGKVVGNTVYNMLKLENIDCDNEDRPIHPPKILNTQVLVNPFPDIIPKVKRPDTVVAPESNEDSNSQSKGTKNFNLLSFGSDAEEEEEETLKVTMDIKGKSKSSHDLIDDPKLSSLPAVDEDALNDEDIAEQPILFDETAVDLPPLPPEPDEEPISKTEELNLEALRLKRELQKSKKVVSPTASGDDLAKIADDVDEDNDLITDYKAQLHKYKELKKTRLKGDDRESETLALLNKFKTRLDTIKTEGEDEEQEIDEDAPFSIDWLKHKLDFSAAGANPSKVIDANVYDADRYDIYDPRNPINKRKRETNSDSQKQLKSRK